MGNENRYTEEDVRRREREAFAAGSDWSNIYRDQWLGKFVTSREAEAEARRRYPIKKRVPRVVQIGENGREYRIKDGWLQVRAGGLDLWSNMVFRAVEIRDLLDNPEQEIEE
jgi:hypothetical protein